MSLLYDCYKNFYIFINQQTSIDERNMSLSSFWSNDSETNILDDDAGLTVGNWMISKINDVSLSLNDTFFDNGNFSTNESSTSFLNTSMITVINISAVVPIELGVPVYGYLAPIVILTTLLTTSFIVVVLSRPQLRSPTNRILLVISVVESLTGLASLPWFLYYYTFRGYVSEEIHGLPPFWCRSFMYFSDMIPTILHTTAIWLTVYLAIQRYVYVRSPSGSYYNFYKTNLAIVIIFVASILLEMPIILGRYTYPLILDNKMACTFQLSYWMVQIGMNNVYAAHFWLFAIIVHAVPCALLVAFTGLLINTLNKAAYRRQHSLGNTGGGRALHATTKMLVVIIVIFLITEIPAAVIFMMHVLNMTLGILSPESYHSMNLALIARNVFILISYPFKFAVYLSMSNQFRTTVKNLFCSSKYAAPVPKHSMAFINNQCRQTRETKCEILDAPSVNCNGFSCHPTEQMDLLPMAEKVDQDWKINFSILGALKFKIKLPLTSHPQTRFCSESNFAKNVPYCLKSVISAHKRKSLHNLGNSRSFAQSINLLLLSDPVLKCTFKTPMYAAVRVSWFHDRYLSCYVSTSFHFCLLTFIKIFWFCFCKKDKFYFTQVFCLCCFCDDISLIKMEIVIVNR